MNGWVKREHGWKWHGVHNYSSYNVVYTHCGLRFHPRDKRQFLSDGMIRTIKRLCEDCENVWTLQELAQ